VAEIVVTAFIANAAPGITYRNAEQSAEVTAWRLHEEPGTPYVAVVGLHDLTIYAVIPDARKATLQALIDDERARNDRA
jgi:hypothetical protein